MANELKIKIVGDASGASKELEKLSKSADYSKKTISQLQTEVKNLNYDVKAGTGSYDNLIKAQNQLANAVARSANAAVLQDSSLKGLQKAYDEISRALKYVQTYAKDSGAADMLQKMADEAKLNIKNEKEFIALLERENKLREEANRLGLQSQTDEAREAYNSVQEEIKQKERLVEAEKLARQTQTEEARKAYQAIIEENRKAVEAEKASANANLRKNRATVLGDNSELNRIEYEKLNDELNKILLSEGKVTEQSMKLGKQMQVLKAEMDKAAKTDLATRMKNLVTSFVSAQAVVWGIRTAFNKLKQTLTEAAEAASYAEETANLFNTTFGNIQGTANSVANSLSSSLGMATSSVQEMVGLFGDLAMGYGQTQSAALEFAESAVKTGLDIISFKNIAGDTTEILQAMASGLAGNFENFRKWGIIVTQAEIKTRLEKKGLDKLTGSALQYAKVQEALAVVQEKSKNATGDMEKTLDSTENITRRLKEANKELLENMGSGINDVLNPIRKMWISIATEINKATKAQREYAKGSTDINVYDIAGSEKDRKTFNKEVNRALDWQYASDQYDTADIINQLKAVMTMFNADMSDFNQAITQTNIFGKEVQRDVNAEVLESIQKYVEEIAKNNEETRQAEKRTAGLENNLSSARSFMDELAGIQGVSISSKLSSFDIGRWSGSDSKQTAGNAIIGKAMKDSISEAIKSLGNADWSAFVEPIKLALEDATEDDGLKAKLDSIASVYELIYNEHLKDGELTEKEKKDLETIAKLYKSINQQAETKKLVASAVTSFGSSSSSMAANTAQLGMSDEGKALYALKAQFDELSAKIKDDSDAMQKLTSAYDDAVAKTKEYYQALEVQNLKEEEAKKLKDFQTETDNWTQKIDTYEMDERAIALYEAKNKYQAEELTTISALINEYYNLVDAEEAQVEAMNKQQIILAGLGDTGAMIEAAMTGDWLSMVMDIVSQLDALEPLLSVISETILPVLNAFLEPMTPLLEVISNIIQTFMVTTLIPLFPILKEIMKIAIMVISILDIAFGFVSDIIKKIVGTIEYGVLTVYNWIVNTLKSINIFGWRPFGWMSTADTSQAEEWMSTDVFGNAERKWDQMNEHLASIDKMSMEIADNTNSDDGQLKAYRELYNNGILTASEYRARLASLKGTNYDNTRIIEGASYYTGAKGATYIDNGNVNIVINGSNLSETELEEAIVRALKSRQRAGAFSA